MRSGDLVFSFKGSRVGAIAAVEAGYRGARFNHMGVVVETPFGAFILEAFPPEVRLTAYPVFARRHAGANGVPRLMFARLKPAHAGLIPTALAYGLAQRDVPYDERYLTDEAALYCSELVVDMFKHANGGAAFFAETPMSFSDPATGEILQHWIEHYADFGMPVPEGQPGSHPGEISLDPRLDIISVQGDIPGYI